MKIKSVLGLILIIIGVYLIFNLYRSSLPLIYGAKVKANIIGTDSVKSKRFTYVYFPILQFNHKNQTIRLTDKTSSVDKNIRKSEVTIYYNQDYGVSQGFTTEKIIFLIMGLLLVLFGIIGLLKL